MALNEYIETLSRVPLFTAFDREALRLVAFSAELAHLSGPETWCSERGEPLGRRLRRG